MSDARANRRFLVAAVAALVVVGVAGGLSWRRSAAPVGSSPAGRGAAAPERPGSAAGAPATGSLPPAAPAEDLVQVPSDLRIEGVDTDRPWVCAGETLTLRARVSGAPPPDVVWRWTWTSARGVERHPGETILWRAPEAPGAHRVTFHACRDLGGRRVGILAEATVDVEVRACAEGEGQDFEPLRVAIEQRGPSRFVLTAVYQGEEPIVAYAWDFGDGTAATTTVPVADHTWPVDGLGTNDVRAWPVRVNARTASGDSLEASGTVFARGLPPPGERPRVALTIARAQFDEDEGRWEADVTIENPEPASITWEALERVTVYFDDRHEVRTFPWRDAIDVVASLPGGGFRGVVVVDPAEVPADVKQIFDRLIGRDAAGREVSVSWTPFKRPPRDEPGRGERIE